jgi:hypothetical protein
MHAASVVELARSAASQLLKKHLDKAQKAGRSPPEAASALRVIAAVCYWRTAVAHRVDISPIMVLPDTVVSYIAWNQPRSTYRVIRCMHGWVHSHKKKHAQRLEREQLLLESGTAPAGRRDRNMFAWYIDRWTPGLAAVVAAPWLAHLLCCSYANRLPVLVQCPPEMPRLAAWLYT